jgi:hypothetical protein
VYVFELGLKKERHPKREREREREKERERERERDICQLFLLS